MKKKLNKTFINKNKSKAKVFESKNFDTLLALSNENLDKMLKKIIGESYNGATLATYDDKVLVIDTENKKLYSMSFSLDTKRGIAMLGADPKTYRVNENTFQEFIITQSPELTENLDKTIYNFFTGKITEKHLAEAFEITEYKNGDFIRQCFESAISSKHYRKGVNFSEIVKAKDKTSKMWEHTKWFENYKRLLIERPLDYIPYINFDKRNPLKVSLVPVKMGIKRTRKDKILKIGSNQNFQKDLKETMKKFFKKDENSSYSIIKFVDKYRQLVHLSESQLKEIIEEAILIVESGNNLKKALTIVKPILEDFKNTKTILKSKGLLKEEDEIVPSDEDEDHVEGEDEDVTLGDDKDDLNDDDSDDDSSVDLSDDDEDIENTEFSSDDDEIKDTDIDINKSDEGMEDEDIDTGDEDVVDDETHEEPDGDEDGTGEPDGDEDDMEENPEMSADDTDTISDEEIDNGDIEGDTTDDTSDTPETDDEISDDMSNDDAISGDEADEMEDLDDDEIEEVTKSLYSIASKVSNSSSKKYITDMIKEVNKQKSGLINVDLMRDIVSILTA